MPPDFLRHRKNVCAFLSVELENVYDLQRKQYVPKGIERARR